MMIMLNNKVVINETNMIIILLLFSLLKYEQSYKNALQQYYLYQKPDQVIPARVGHTGKSETLYPQIITYNYDNKHNDKVFNISFCDCPGFSDTREGDESICAALSIPITVIKSTQVRAVIVAIEYESTSPNMSRGFIFRQLSKTLSSLFKQPLDDIPLLFAFTKPPELAQKKYFDTKYLKKVIMNRINENLEEFNSEAFNKKIQEIQNEIDLNNIKLIDCGRCIAELNSLNRSVKGINYWGKLSGLLSGQTEKLQKGNFEKHVEDQCIKWKREGISENAINELSNLIRSIWSKDEASRLSEILAKHSEWQKEEKELRKDILEKQAALEEKIAEKDILNLINNKKSVFVIRGFEDEKTRNHPDDRELLLQNISEMYEKSTEIPREKFNFSADKPEFKNLSMWLKTSTAEITDTIRKLLELPQKIEKLDSIIHLKHEEIKNEKLILMGLLFSGYLGKKEKINSLAVVARNNLETERKENETFKSMIAKEEKHQTQLKAKIDEIEKLDEIDYMSSLDIDHRSNLGKYTWQYTSWTYIFPHGITGTIGGKIINLKERLNSYLNWFFSNEDKIPIERVELSNLVKDGRIGFKTRFDSKTAILANITLKNNFSMLTVDEPDVKLKALDNNGKICEVVPDEQNSSSHYKKFGQFEKSNSYDLEKGIFEIKYVTDYSEDGFGAVRIFVLPKKLPENIKIINETRAEIDSIETLLIEYKRQIENIQKRIDDDEKFLKLMDDYNPKTFLERIEKSILRLDYNENNFVKVFFPNANSNVLWFKNKDILNGLIHDFQKLDDAKILEKFQISKDDLNKYLGTQEKSEQQTSTIEPMSFKEIIEICERTGLTFKNIHEILLLFSNENNSDNNKNISKGSDSSLLEELNTYIDRRQTTFEEFKKRQSLYAKQLNIISTIKTIDSLKINLDESNKVSELLKLDENAENSKIINKEYKSLDRKFYEGIKTDMLEPITFDEHLKLMSLATAKKINSDIELSDYDDLNADSINTDTTEQNFRPRRLYLTSLLEGDNDSSSWCIKMLKLASEEVFVFYSFQLIEVLRKEFIRNDASQDLSTLLIDRAAKSKIIASNLYWSMKVRKSTLNINDTYVPEKYRKLIEKLKETNNIEIINQEELLEKVKKIRRLKKKGEIINSNDCQLAPAPFILDPNFYAREINHEKIHVYNTKLKPCKFVFKIENNGTEYAAIYKEGDDLRKDHVVTQFIFLADKILKQENLDLMLTPYKVMPTGKDEGLIEYVDAEPLSSIYYPPINNAGYSNISGFLKAHNAWSYDMAIDTFIKTLAGYTIVNYILDTGDRNLNNILLKKSGEIFHIDFAYILGYKTYIYQPSIKITNDMVETIGGLKSENFKRFLEYCSNAFVILRKHSLMLMEIFEVLIHSQISVIDRTSLTKLHERFRLDLDDRKADEWIKQKVSNSCGSGYISDILQTYI